MKQAVNIVILGGVVMDLIFEVPEWPQVRQAVQATSFTMQPGGKGLNQALAATRLGAHVSVISAVGPDRLGDLLLSQLQEENIDYQFVERRSAIETDATCVIIDKGDPGFIGAKLATTTVDSKLVRKAEPYISNADAIMATGEVPLDAVRTAFEIARDHKVTTIFNPAPPERLGSSILSLTDYLVPNQWEATVAAGEKRGISLPLENIARKLRREKANDVIITNGSFGCLALIGNEAKNFESFDVEVFDTTGASDAFCAALGIALAERKSINDAITLACASGALACMKFGAATSMPNKSSLNDFLKRRGFSISLN